MSGDLSGIRPGDCPLRTQYSVLSTQYHVSLPARLSTLTALLILFFQTPGYAQDPSAFGQVRSIFAANCLACHGKVAHELKGDYDLGTREAAIKGGETGEAAIVPGQPEKSPLYRAITWQ